MLFLKKSLYGFYGYCFKIILKSILGMKIVGLFLCYDLFFTNICDIQGDKCLYAKVNKLSCGYFTLKITFKYLYIGYMDECSNKIM